MTQFWRNRKLIAAVLGSIGGGTLIGLKYATNKHDSEAERRAIEGSSKTAPKGPLQLPSVLASWTTDFTPSVAWDHNWDRRSPKSLLKPFRNSGDSVNNNNDYNEKLEAVKSKAVRHIILIRHGQYYEEEGSDEKRILTPLGREQADFVGKRLQELNLPYTSLVSSTMSRALETADFISKHLPEVQRSSTDLLREGAPIPPEPSVGHWRPNLHFYEDGARIEAAFRHYFHRAPASQEKDSYDILVCHANVIRYFVCRALQFPPEAWLRLSLHHASLTWLVIQPNGRVGMVAMGDFGFMPSKKLSKR